ncbi:TrbI F-type domain-containing protein [Novosphingobium sp. MD-1]|uniref:TrbI F-type domain-containing protein n=1 Tax=Novosphingobium sp. MD-1 TaxID=1630648 RepID=UPI00061BC59B|nr:TrbI F-type domain-containing protein [Novosphingobium sp. MD-1]GAO52882.1 conjugative transfer protein ELI_00880 [Novosphingobium sp. MD-1]
MATTAPSLPDRDPSSTQAGTDTPVPDIAPAKRRRGFAGFSWGQILGGAAVAGALLWGAWITRDVHALKDRRIVSVNLAAMANDFVMAEARAGNSPEQTEADTRQYMAALQAVLRHRAATGETILVGEAVVSSSTPNITAEVRKAVGKVMLANPAPRVASPPAGGAAQPGTGNAGVPGTVGQGGVMPSQIPSSGAMITGSGNGVAGQ